MRILIFLFLKIPRLATAQLIQNIFIDTTTMSLGNAVTADQTCIMDIHFIPAGLTKLEGRQIQIQLMNIMLSAEANFSLPEDYDPDQAGLVPIHEDPILNDPKSKAIAAAYLPGVGILPMHLPVLTLPTGGVSIQPAGSKF